MSKKNIAVLTIAGIILIGIIVLVAMNSKQGEVVSPGTVPAVQKKTETINKPVPPEKNIPKDNVTTDQMTKEQADFA